jgi:hypothetical protein
MLFVWLLIALIVGFFLGRVHGMKLGTLRAEDRIFLAERKARWLADWLRIAARHNATLCNVQREVENAISKGLVEYDRPDADEQPDRPRGYE